MNNDIEEAIEDDTDIKEAEEVIERNEFDVVAKDEGLNDMLKGLKSL